MDKRIFLEETASGHASYNFLLYLRKTVHEEMGKREKSEERIKLEDKRLDHIAEILTRHIPVNFFWEKEIIGVLKDMDRFKFEEQGSVNRKVKKISAFFERESAFKISCFEKINLLDHTHNVVKVCEEYANKGRYKKVRAFDVIFASLLHDFGKSNLLQIEVLGCLPYLVEKTHEELGFNYVSQRINSLNNKLINMGFNGIHHAQEVKKYLEIANAVLGHHEKNMEEENLKFYVQEADREARRREWENFAENNPELIKENLVKDYI